MTTLTLNLEWQYSYWYERAINYVFDFFEDPLYSNVEQKNFLSNLLLDPKTLLIVLVYVVYKGKILLNTWSRNYLNTHYTNVTKQVHSRFTSVSKATEQANTFVNDRKMIIDLNNYRIKDLQLRTKLQNILTASGRTIIRGWAFLRIFRTIKPIYLDNYLTQWKKTIAPFLLSGFRYYLIGPKSPVNTPFSGSSFC